MGYKGEMSDYKLLLWDVKFVRLSVWVEVE